MPRGVHPNSLANLKKGKATQFGADGDATAKAAGEKSAAMKAERRSLREVLLMILEGELTDRTTGKKVNTRYAMSAAIVKAALDGNTKAYEIIRDTIGEKPVENVALTTLPSDIIDKTERALFGGDDE